MQRHGKAEKERIVPRKREAMQEGKRMKMDIEMSNRENGKLTWSPRGKKKKEKEKR